MQPAGLRTALHKRAPCRSAVVFHAAHPLRPLLFHPGRLSIFRATNGPLDGGAPPGLGPGSGPHGATGDIASSGAGKELPAPAAAAPDGAPSGDAAAAAPVTPTAAASGGASEPAAAAAVDPVASASSQQQQPGQAAGASPAAAVAASSPAAAAATAASGASNPLPPFVQQLLAWLASVWSAVQQFPLWVQMQHLRRLREACEEDPKDADKHAAYLSELVRSNPREVLARVESRQFGVNSAVVAEYLRALIATGKVTELVKADGAAAAAASASAAAAAAAVAPEVPPPRTMGELLRDLQEQLTSAATDGSDAAAAATAAAAPGGAVAASLEMPGSSVRRPLHVVVGGLPPLQSASSASQPASNTPLLLRPLALLWRLISAAVLFLVLAVAFIAGSQAIRRVQASGGAFVNPAAVSTAGPPVAAAGGGGSGNGGSGAASSSSSSNGGPSVEPKEYKKDELPEKSIRTFKDVKGCDEAKEELREVVEFLKNPTKFTRLGAKLPKGVLLSGPPGTGKTLLAKAVAGEAGVPFFYRAGSEFEELYVGVGSRRMRALFSAAKKRSPCIVFIDEIDAIGGNRKAWENHTRKTLNQLLVEMDGFESTEGIIVMAATNLPESLDPALKRPGRFDRQVAVPLPDIKGRRDILEYYMSDKPLGTDVDRELLARQTQGFSGADLSNLINEGAILAAKEGSDTITQRMLDWAYDKILMGVERKSVKRTLEARRRTAYHEAGHALVALSTAGASPIHKATIVPRGHALGMVMQVGREDEFSINRQQMLARIRVCMGGTVAEELVFGSDQVSSGATDDLRQATSMARHMVTECGMSAAIGPVYVAGGDERHGGSAVSEATRQRVDAEVSGMLGEAKEAVRALLTERMQDLRTLAEALLDRETLTREEINSLLQQGDQQTPPPPGSGGGGGGDKKQRDGDEQPQPQQLEGDPAQAAAAPAAAAAEASPASESLQGGRWSGGVSSAAAASSAHPASEAEAAAAASTSTSALSYGESARAAGAAGAGLGQGAGRWRGGQEATAEASGRSAAAAAGGAGSSEALAAATAAGAREEVEEGQAAAAASDERYDDAWRSYGNGNGSGEGEVDGEDLDGAGGVEGRQRHRRKLLLLRQPEGRQGGGQGRGAGAAEDDDGRRYD
ncbi:hypothetical protein PLESTB_000685100 [Pleodorina starrii]|uniref:AAA+ ATPase domain-containing protein n=1 Tax=Pleodorina starrii TaxID=330485 RepID=A0A9W6F259_9CHLO|nr:hypothetical protein PLESTM_001231800 [Pleodorina starrii]GLC52891.1 hypothetical protein PLESTB_000685100 [Pleodorina starrii]